MTDVPAQTGRAIGAGKSFRGDLAGGLTAAVVLLAVEGSYGLIAFSFLGAEQAQIGFVLGVCTAAFATLAALAAGGRGPMLSGSSAALALLVPTLIGALILDSRFTVDGQPQIPMLLACVAVGVVAAGVLQAVVVLFRLGSLVRYVPYPVHAGYMNGVAVLMIVAMAPYLLGVPYGQALSATAIQPLAPLVALVAFVFAVRPPAGSKRVPAYLAALLTATAVHHLIALTPAGLLLGPTFEPPALAWPTVAVLAPVASIEFREALTDNVWLLVQFAAAIAFVSSLQTALAGSTIDELTRTRRNRERELLAQGFANMAVGAVGGLPTAGAVGRTKVNLDAGGKTGLSQLFFSLSLLVALVIGLRYLRFVPMAAIAGVFSAVAFSLVDAWTRRATPVVWRQSLKWRLPRALAQSYGVMLLVAGIAVFVSLPIAIGVGVVVAVLMFIRGNIKQTIRRISYANERPSRKIRVNADTEFLRANGRRIALVELDGALFFGTAEATDAEIERLAEGCDSIVLDFESVTEVDASGARVLLQAADAVRRAGRQLLFAGLMPRDARMRMITEMDVQGRINSEQFFADADRALEFAEDRLLAGVGCSSDCPALSLQEMLGGAYGEAELQVLRSLMTERRVARGDTVFRHGEAGDRMFFLMQGQVGIWLPESDGRASSRDRRLVSFAPGVVFGEMGLLAQSTRSANAVAEADSLLLELDHASYQRLKHEHPATFGKLMLTISLQLSSRLRSLTDELRLART